MTAKQNAQILFDNYYIVCQEFTEEIQCSIQAKQCALIAIDEVLSNDGWSSSREEWAIFKKYCEEVKKEIENL